MSVVRVNFMPEFHFGDDAVLVTLDGSGTGEMLAALGAATRDGLSKLRHDGVTQEFRIELGAAAIELSPTHVLWRLDLVKAAEIQEDLAALSGGDGTRAGHFYVDLATPAETLVVSRDEYVDVVYPWASPE